MSSSVGSELLLELSASFVEGFAILRKGLRKWGPFTRVFKLEMVIFVPSSKAFGSFSFSAGPVKIMNRII